MCRKGWKRLVKSRELEELKRIVAIYAIDTQVLDKERTEADGLSPTPGL
jgi:hypothetical protein